MKRVLVAVVPALALAGWLAVPALGCGGRASAPVAPQLAAPGIAAARWVPANPSYVFASPSLRDAQHALSALSDLAGVAAGEGPRDTVRAATALLSLDARDVDPLPALGVDLDGSWAVFSDALSPTLVVHLAAPERMAAFLDRQRRAGLVTRSQVVDRTELVSAQLFGGVSIQWAIAGDWMWIHVSPPGRTEMSDEGTAWFTASHRAHAAGWAGDWAWAVRASGAARGVVGFLDPRGAIARALQRVPEAVACGKQVASVRRVAAALEVDGPRVEARLAFDVGPPDAIDAIRRSVLAPPSGWAPTAARAAIAAQWNLDLAAARAWLSPCLAVAGAELGVLDDTGVRAARGLLLDFDPDAMSGSGALALDLARATYFERQLDRIPLRRTLERARRFGPYRGHSIEIPFSITVDYVLDAERAIVALGDGLLARLVAPAPGAPRAPPPLFALEISPPAMSAEAWQTVLHSLAARELSGAAGPATRRTVERLMRWRSGRLAVTLSPSELVLTLSGHRR